MSIDLPTGDAFQPQYGGGDLDGFLAAFSPDLGNLCYGSYRGGTDREFLEGIDTSPTNLVYATGVTWSRDLRMTANGVQNVMAPVIWDGKTVNATLVGLRGIRACQRQRSSKR